MITDDHQFEGSQPESRQLDELFARYRAACPDVEPSTNFMPALWQRIEKRGSVSTLLPKLARLTAAATAAACLLLTVLIGLPGTPSRKPLVPASYTDALYADHTAEKTYYTEAIRSTYNLVPDDYRH
jgi:hypothetical protein